MNRPIVTLLLASGAVLLAATYGIVRTYQHRHPPAPIATSSVKIVFETGHGSGVVINKSYVLTAQHVVTDRKTVKVKDSLGTEVDAEVLWASPKYDVALLKAHLTTASSEIECSRVPGGTYLEARGNPGPFEQIKSYGRLSGSHTDEDGRRFDIVDMTVAPGMSGGGAFDTKGRLRGLVQAVFTQRMGFGVSLVPFTYLVPAEVICELLAKGTGFKN